jgi:hypothetical protein
MQLEKKETSKSGPKEIERPPVVVRDKFQDQSHHKSKRLRVTSHYMDKGNHYLPLLKPQIVYIERIHDGEGIYEGDILDQVTVTEQKTPTPIKKIEKVKHGKGVQMFSNGDLYNGDWNEGKMHGAGGYYFS